MKGSSEEARSIKSHLDMFKIKIIDVQIELIHKNINITSEALKNKLLDIQERQRTLIPIFKDHNNKVKELVGREYSTGTLQYIFKARHRISGMEIQNIRY